MSKSTLATVLKRAEEARILLSGKSTRRKGLEVFDLLAREHPRDGMIYFKRAEALEALGESREAAQSYRKAQEFFFKKLWRDLAKSRAERLEKDIEVTELKEKVEAALGPAAHARDLSHIAESAWLAGRFAKEYASVSLELSRTALVRAILALERRFPDQLIADGQSQSGSWYQRLDRAAEAKVVTQDTVKRAKNVLYQRGKAVYEGKLVSPTQAQVAFDTIVRFLRDAFRR